MKLLTDLHQITDISGPPDFSRNTIQLTLFDLYIKTLLASKRNLISSEASSTRFSAINLLYLRLPMKLLTILHQIADISGPPTSRGTQCNWHLSIYTSKHFTPLNAIKYIINLLQQTFPITIKHTLRSTNKNPHGSQLNHRHLRQLSDFSRNTIQFNTFRFIYQNTLHI